MSIAVWGYVAEAVLLVVVLALGWHASTWGRDERGRR
jgi:hypothetical protein